MQDDRQRVDRVEGDEPRKAGEKGTRKTGLGTADVVENADRPDEC